MSDIHTELAEVITEFTQPSRIDIVRAKRVLLAALGDGLPHRSEDLLRVVADLLGTEPLARALHVDLRGRVPVRQVVTADHLLVASLRGDAIAREALAELNAEGMIIAVGRPEPAPDPQVQVGYDANGVGSSVRVEITRPALPAQAVRLPHRLRQAGLWGIEPDIFAGNTDALGLGPRTRRCIHEAIESYRRGAFLAAASLLGAAVEGAWYAAAEQLVTLAPGLRKLAENDQTGKLQDAVTAVLRGALPGGRKWEADSLGQFAGLMRTIRNYGVHPREHDDEGIEVYFEEDRCGLLFLEAHRHLRRLAELAVQVRDDAKQQED